MDISSKLSLYDMLAMIVPGWMIVVGCLLYINGLQPLLMIFAISSVLGYASLLILAYLIGLVWNTFMDFIFCWFRNTPCMIKSAYRKEIANYRVEDIMTLYYQCYYYVHKNKYSNTISIMESQVAMLRNTVVIVLGYGIVQLLGLGDSTRRKQLLHEMWNFAFHIK